MNSHHTITLDNQYRENAKKLFDGLKYDEALDEVFEILPKQLVAGDYRFIASCYLALAESKSNDSLKSKACNYLLKINKVERTDADQEILEPFLRISIKSLYEQKRYAEAINCLIEIAPENYVPDEWRMMASCYLALAEKAKSEAESDVLKLKAATCLLKIAKSERNADDHKIIHQHCSLIRTEARKQYEQKKYAECVALLGVISDGIWLPEEDWRMLASCYQALAEQAHSELKLDYMLKACDCIFKISPLRVQDKSFLQRHPDFLRAMAEKFYEDKWNYRVIETLDILNEKDYLPNDWRMKIICFQERVTKSPFETDIFQAAECFKNFSVSLTSANWEDWKSLQKNYLALFYAVNPKALFEKPIFRNRLNQFIPLLDASLVCFDQILEDKRSLEDWCCYLNVKLEKIFSVLNDEMQSLKLSLLVDLEKTYQTKMPNEKNRSIEMWEILARIYELYGAYYAKDRRFYIDAKWPGTEFGKTYFKKALTIYYHHVLSKLPPEKANFKYIEHLYKIICDCYPGSGHKSKKIEYLLFEVGSYLLTTHNSISQYHYKEQFDALALAILNDPEYAYLKVDLHLLVQIFKKFCISGMHSQSDPKQWLYGSEWREWEDKFKQEETLVSLLSKGATFEVGVAYSFAELQSKVVSQEETIAEQKQVIEKQQQINDLLVNKVDLLEKQMQFLMANMPSLKTYSLFAPVVQGVDQSQAAATASPNPMND